MPNSGYFDVIFASSGSTATVPDGIQSDGSVSYTQGYGVDYTLDPNTNPSALNIEQTKFNQLLYDITSAIQYIQQNGAAPFITTSMNNGTAYSYAKGAIVSYDPGSGIQNYYSSVSSNTTTPTDSSWVALGAGSLGRTKLTTNTTYYVSTTGNDTTGNGTSGNPWATPQHAVNYIVAGVDLGGFTATISCADGTYTTPVIISNPWTGSGNVILQGNISTPSNCILHTTSANCVQVNNGCQLSIQGFELETTTSGNGIDSAGYLGIIGNMNFGTMASGQAHMTANTGGVIVISSSYTISGNAAQHLGANQRGEIAMAAGTVTLSGTPAFSVFAQATDLGLLTITGVSYSGSGTGTYYSATANSVIDTGGSGPTFFPGNSAGSTGTGGQYL